MSISSRCRSSKAEGQGSAWLQAQVTLATDVTFLMVFLFAGISICGGYSGLWNLTWHLFFSGMVWWQEADTDFFGVLSWRTPTCFPSPLKYAWEKKQILDEMEGSIFIGNRRKHAGKAGERGAPIGAEGGAGFYK